MALMRARLAASDVSRAGSGNATGTLPALPRATNVVRAAAAAALLGGHVQGMFATVPSAVAYIKDGRLKALVVTSEKREAALPAIPSAAEAGLPGLIVSTWNGVLAPAGTPRAIVVKLNAEIAKAAHMPEMVERYAAQAAEVYTTTPEQFATIVRNDFAKWSKVVKDIGLRGN